MKFVEREIFPELKDQLNDNKISLIIGPRQVGKTTLLKKLYSIVENNSLFLDLDIFSNYEKVSTYDSFINTLKLNGYTKDLDCFYVFLDEFQRYDDFSRILKNVYDHHDNIKIFASGSSSILIKNSVQESLAGRKKMNYLYPFSFKEFLKAKDSSLIEIYDNVKKIKGSNLKSQLKELYDFLYEFMIFGGYPEVVLSNNIEEKKSSLNNIFDLYLKKDILDYLDPSKVRPMKDVVEYLAINNGKKVKYSKISNSLNISYRKSKEYVEILNESYLVSLIRPYFTNKNKELVKLNKCYFLDHGVRNHFINNFNELHLRNDSGELFETFIISEFIKRGYDNLKYWEDKNQNEVDLIIDLVSKIIPIEIKFKDRLRKSDFKGLEKFMFRYNSSGYLINLSKQEFDDEIKLVLPFSLSIFY
ncbi:MAG: ATP-binding protein [archaeon]